MATLPTLPTEIIAEILSRLPPKPLCRFKCVAKHWKTLINSQIFIKQHLKRILIPNNLIICHDSLSVAEFRLTNPKSVKFSDLNHPVNDPNVKFLGSCNGLVCISNTVKSTVFIYNPATKDHLLVPSVPYYAPCNCNKVDHIAVFGFGFDSGTDDYKLLRVLESYENSVLVGREASLYSLRDGLWRSVNDGFISYLYLPFNGVHVDGVFYFDAVNECMVPSVRWFDLRFECFGVLELFEYERGFDHVNLVLSELGGCFCLMVNYMDHVASCDLMHGWSMRRLDLWVMKEHCKKESWVRLFSILDPERIESLTNVKALLYSKDGDKVLLELDGLELSWYDWGNNKFERVEVSGLPGIDISFDAYTFVESLVSLKTDKDKEKDEKPKGKTVQKKIINKKTSDRFLSAGFKLRL